MTSYERKVALAMAARYFSAGMFEEGIARCQSAQVEPPRSALILCGHALLKLERLHAAKVSFEAADEPVPRDALIAFRDTLLKRGEVDKVWRVFRRERLEVPTEGLGKIGCELLRSKGLRAGALLFRKAQLEIPVEELIAVRDRMSVTQAQREFQAARVPIPLQGLVTRGLQFLNGSSITQGVEEAQLACTLTGQLLPEQELTDYFRRAVRLGYFRTAMDSIQRAKLTLPASVLVQAGDQLTEWKQFAYAARAYVAAGHTVGVISCATRLMLDGKFRESVALFRTMGKVLRRWLRSSLPLLFEAKRYETAEKVYRALGRRMPPRRYAEWRVHVAHSGPLGVALKLLQGKEKKVPKTTLVTLADRLFNAGKFDEAERLLAIVARRRK